jgi:RimJ/RimL family protein N-acetyltransferase
MQLQNISMDDQALLEIVYCDPRMLAHLGDPMPRDEVPQKLRSVVEGVESGASWYFKIILDEHAGQAVGTVCVWPSTFQGQPISEIGWAIFPDYQGQGLGSRAVAAVLEKARLEKRWGVIHAFPATSNGPSNGLTNKTGFSLLEECDLEYRGHTLHCNHWVIDLHSG